MRWHAGSTRSGSSASPIQNASSWTRRADAQVPRARAATRCGARGFAIDRSSACCRCSPEPRELPPPTRALGLEAADEAAGAGAAAAEQTTETAEQAAQTAAQVRGLRIIHREVEAHLIRRVLAEVDVAIGRVGVEAAGVDGVARLDHHVRGQRVGALLAELERMIEQQDLLAVRLLDPELGTRGEL